MVVGDNKRLAQYLWKEGLMQSQPGALKVTRVDEAISASDGLIWM